MFHLKTMVTDLEEFVYYNTDQVSNAVDELNYQQFHYIFITVGNELDKVQVGKVENGMLIFDENESISTLFEGLHFLVMCACTDTRMHT